MSEQMPNFQGLTEAVLKTSSPLAEGVENLRRAAGAAYWDFEALGSTLMDALQGKMNPN